ncbi:hypothetical protein SDC9_199917 [bioreactor metagenome]|uniref:Uncharacterized protein n=1 Tax=bioreactor metagenome TaxID=1076179 RepID=A0A645ILU0_9ZZZZ
MPSTGHPRRCSGHGGIQQPGLAASDTAPQKDAARHPPRRAFARTGHHLREQPRQLLHNEMLRRVRLNSTLRKMAEDRARIARFSHDQAMWR